MPQQPPQDPRQPQQPQQPQGMPPQWAAQQQPYSQPQTPQYGQPHQPPYQGPAPYQPPQPPKRKAGKIVGFGCLGVVALFVIVGIAAAAGGGSDDSNKAGTSVATPKDDTKPAAKGEDKPAPKKDLSQADQFKAYVAKNGTPTEQAAVKHVTKVQGADSDTGIADIADVYTDYTGGIMGPHQADGKLLASAFADWKTSKNGLVTVYDAKGELLSNGQY